MKMKACLRAILENALPKSKNQKAGPFAVVFFVTKNGLVGYKIILHLLVGF